MRNPDRFSGATRIAFPSPACGRGQDEGKPNKPIPLDSFASIGPPFHEMPRPTRLQNSVPADA